MCLISSGISAVSLVTPPTLLMNIDGAPVMATVQLACWPLLAFVVSHVSTDLIMSSLEAPPPAGADADGTGDTDFAVRFFAEEDPDEADPDDADSDLARGAESPLRSRDAIALT